MEKKYIIDKTKKILNIKKQQFKEYLKKGKNAQIFVSGLGVLILSTQVLAMYPKAKETEKITKVSYTTQLKNNNKTYVDELLSKDTKEYIKKLEQYLPLSEKINDLDNKVNINIKPITTKEEYEKLNLAKYTPEKITKDIKKLEQYIENRKNNQLDLKYPTKNVEEYYKLAKKVLRDDASVCNNIIAEAGFYLPSLYFNTVMSAYLQESGLSIEDEKKRLIYEYISETEGYKIDLDVKKSREDTRTIPYCKINVDNFNEEVKELHKEYDTYQDSQKEVFSEYDKDRNFKIRKALNNAKLLFYYDYKVKNHGDNEELVGTLSYKKMKKSR